MENKVFILSSVLVLVVAVFLMGFLMYSFQSLPQNAPQDITVSGTGKAYIKPDIANVNLGVTTNATKSQDTVNQNNEKMNAIILAVKKLGVEDKDIQTTLYNLSPVYDYTQYGSKFKGYSLNQQITVKIRNFDKINDILDAATTNGATNVGDLQFTVDNMDKVRADARTKAIADAKQKAQALASESGLKLVKLVNISESNYGNYPQPLYGMGVAKEISSSVAPSVQTGQMEIDSTISLTYKVK